MKFCANNKVKLLLFLELVLGVAFVEDVTE